MNLQERWGQLEEREKKLLVLLRRPSPTTQRRQVLRPMVVPKLPLAVRYSVYAAVFYLTMLFGNFGGAEFIYFQF